MQRVLSFQMARGFGEPSEFVTKRMCFSFLFSVGFLCLLCGFLTGRFAAGRASDLKAEKTRLEHAGNGLVVNEHLREFLVQRIHERQFNPNNTSDGVQNFSRIKNNLQDLQYFNGIVGNESCISATIRGCDEPDRYVVVAAVNEGISVVLELLKVLKSLHDDYEWTPRRTMIFMLSLKSSESCYDFLQDYVRDRVVAFIELDLPSISGSGYFVAAGSDIVQSSILKASAGLQNPSAKSQHGQDPKTTNAGQEIIYVASIPRLRLDVPNTVIKFASSKNWTSEVNSTSLASSYRQLIGEIIGTSIWRLSEMMLFKWDPRDENQALIDILSSANSSLKYGRVADDLINEINKMTENVAAFNENIDKMDTTDRLHVRVANDLSMRCRRLLLCNDRDLQSRTDWFTLKKYNDTSSWPANYLASLSSCYKTVNELLQEYVT